MARDAIKSMSGYGNCYAVAQYSGLYDTDSYYKNRRTTLARAKKGLNHSRRIRFVDAKWRKSCLVVARPLARLIHHIGTAHPLR